MLADEGGMDGTQGERGKERGRGSDTYFLEITKTPIPNQKTIILNESLGWILFISSNSSFQS
jgi:hypothetical protein